MSTLTTDLTAYLPNSDVIAAQVAAALAEDVGAGDLTAALIPAEQTMRAELITREPAVLCGCAWFEMVFKQLDSNCRVNWVAHDGERITPGQLLCTVEGRTRALLTGERTAMNYLQMLSGTATRAQQFADAVAGLLVQVLDTRKTLPGLRIQQKYAVRCGGCHNHRIGLFDMILIKENHILAAGSIPAALAAAQALNAEVAIEIEVESLAELALALDGGAQLILLDNFSLAQLREAVVLNAGRAQLEASGNMNLTTLRTVAETGVNRISVGGLTKDVTAVDLSLRLMKLPLPITTVGASA